MSIFTQTEKRRIQADTFIIRCPYLSCDWNMIWHRFDLLDIGSKKNIKCRRCGVIIPSKNIKGARYDEIFHLPAPREEYVEY